MSGILQQVQALRQQLLSEHSQAPGLFRELASIESLLAETYRARVLYELLQNSDDAGSTVIHVDMRTPGEMVWSNDGRPFSLADIEALCRSASSTKKRGGDTIGYRGIGFKAVAAVASTVRVASGGVTMEFDRTGAAELLGANPEETPLLRVPARVAEGQTATGAVFTFLLTQRGEDDLKLDPIALLFLRNVTQVVIHKQDGSVTIQCTRSESRVTLSVDGVDATFHRAAREDTVLLIPADQRAEALAGRRGRLCCFLPLEDELGLPAIASGPLLTDPSRTHAVLADTTTQRVLANTGQLLAEALLDTRGPGFDRLWHLLVGGEDLRMLALAGSTTISGFLLSEVKTELANRQWPFSFSEVPLDQADVAKVFPQGAPQAIYAEEHLSPARALRTVLGGPTLRAQELAERVDPNTLTAATRSSLATRIVETARVEGRVLTAREQAFVGRTQPATSPSQDNGQPKSSRQTSGQEPRTFGGAVARWRVAEIAAMEHLNSRGWTLEDVSRQNLGYDLVGSDPDGHTVHIEVKKVESKDSRFSLTNNELSVMVAASARYLLAIAIGDGQQAQLALLDPMKDQVPRERVCRRWEWEYTDWSRYVELVH